MSCALRQKYNYMLGGKVKERAYKIRLTATTWYKDSHSLFDYESTKVTQTKFQFDFQTKGINFYRKKNNSSEVSAIDCKYTNNQQNQDFDFIGHFEVQHTNKGVKVNVLNVSTYRDRSKTTNTEKQKTNQSIDSINQKEEEPYFIVGRDKNLFEAHGCKLIPGMTLKLGRIEYYISQLFDGTKKSKKQVKNPKALFNENVLTFIFGTEPKNDTCKICLQDHNKQEDFLFNPCGCKGSTGSVHFECLTEWIRVKVKKDVIGGTQHYNFTKFECQVCKKEFPGYVEVVGADGNKYIKQTIGVEKPTSQYVILQSACQKEKSIMVVQNTPQEGIKIGRGHECQIRITDISVSRKHAIIRSIKNDFYISDNKSKFGTLVREQSMSFEMRRQQQKRSIQIGRTILEFELVK